MGTTTDFLAADIGASNGRVLLARWDGESFGLEVIHRFANGPVDLPGRQNWDVLRLWDEVKTGIAQYATLSSSPPASIGVDTWGVDFGLLDAKGQLLGNPVHYRDVRTNGILEQVFPHVSRADIFAETGLQFIQFNTLFQLASMRIQGDPQLDFAHRLLMTPDLLHYWMTGEQVAEYTIASTSQMLHARERRWATGLMARLDLPTGILPPIVEPGTLLGNLLPYVADSIGLSGPLPVIAAGSHDTASAVAAVPNLDRESIYLSSGTWSLMGIEIPEPIIDDRVLARNFTNEGGVGNTIRFLKNISGLWMLQEARSEWQRGGQEFSWTQLLAQAEAAEPFRSIVDPDDAVFLNPANMVNAIQEFCRGSGQPAPETVGQVVRCALESLALRYRSVVLNLEELCGHALNTIRVVGGGSQNRILNQFTADACQRPVITGPVEATALGNVMIQAIATGHLANIEEGRAAIEASIEQERFEPGPGDAWDAAYERFDELTG